MSKPASVHALLGPENGQKMDFLAALRKQIQVETKEPPEEHRIYPDKIDGSDLASLLQNASLFARHKLVVLSEAQELKRKAEIDPLVEYLEHPNPDATLVFLSDGYSLDRRLEKAVPKSRRKVFWELFENQKRDWLRKYFRQQKISLDPDAAELILDMVDNDTQDLRRECEKLAVYFGPDTTIDEDAVEQLIYHSKEENVFTLFERIVSRDFEASLETLQTILLAGGGDSVQLMGGLLWQFRRLLGLARLQQRQYGMEDAYRHLKIRGKKNQKTYALGARNYSANDLEKVITLIAEYEAQLRSVRGEMQKILVQLFLFQVVVKLGRT